MISSGPLLVKRFNMIDLNLPILIQRDHSGDASLIVPKSFRILRTPIERIEDSRTG